MRPGEDERGAILLGVLNHSCGYCMCCHCQHNTHCLQIYFFCLFIRFFLRSFFSQCMKYMLRGVGGYGDEDDPAIQQAVG